MPLNNRARQQLRNFYILLQKVRKNKNKNKRTLTVSRTTNNNLKANKKELSPRIHTTKTGRNIKVWPRKVKGPSGAIYSIQTVRPNSRRLTNT